ncbi:unnamed protein product, partial [Didymodactylos carnosus]
LQDIKYIPNMPQQQQQQKSPVMGRQQSDNTIDNRRKKGDQGQASSDQGEFEKSTKYENQRYSDEFHAQIELEPKTQNPLSFVQNSDAIYHSFASSHMSFASNNIIAPSSIQKAPILQQVAAKLSPSNDSRINTNMNDNLLSNLNIHQLQPRPLFPNNQHQISPVQCRYNVDQMKIISALNSSTYQSLNLQPVTNLQQPQLNNSTLVKTPIKALHSPASPSCSSSIGVKQSDIDQTIEDVISGKVFCSSVDVLSSPSKAKRAKVLCQSMPSSPDKPAIFFSPIQGNSSVWQQPQQSSCNSSTHQNFTNLSHQEFSKLAEQLILQPSLENTATYEHKNNNTSLHKTIVNNNKIKKQKPLAKKEKLRKIEPLVQMSPRSPSPPFQTTTTTTTTKNLLTNILTNQSETSPQEEGQQQQTVALPTLPTLNIIDVSVSEPLLPWPSTISSSDSQQSSSISILPDTNKIDGRTTSSSSPAVISTRTNHQEEKNSDTWNFGSLFSTTFQLVGDYAEIDNNQQEHHHLRKNDTGILKSIQDQEESNHPYSCTRPLPAPSLSSTSSCSTSGLISVSDSFQNKESKSNINDEDLYEQFLNPSLPWHETPIRTTTTSESLIIPNDGKNQQYLTKMNTQIHSAQSQLIGDSTRQFRDLFLSEVTI